MGFLDGLFLGLINIIAVIMLLSFLIIISRSLIEDSYSSLDLLLVLLELVVIIIGIETAVYINFWSNNK